MKVGVKVVTVAEVTVTVVVEDEGVAVGLAVRNVGQVKWLDTGVDDNLLCHSWVFEGVFEVPGCVTLRV